MSQFTHKWYFHFQNTHYTPPPKKKKKPAECKPDSSFLSFLIHSSEVPQFHIYEAVQVCVYKSEEYTNAHFRTGDKFFSKVNITHLQFTQVEKLLFFFFLNQLQLLVLPLRNMENILAKGFISFIPNLTWLALEPDKYDDRIWEIMINYFSIRMSRIFFFYYYFKKGFLNNASSRATLIAGARL